MKGSQVNVRKVLLSSKLLLVLVLCAVAAKALVSLRRPKFAVAPGSAVGSGVGEDPFSYRAAGGSRNDDSIVIARNIFSGRDLLFEGGPWEPSLVASSSLPSAEEELGLTLVGVVCGPASVSRALVKDARSNSTDLYRIGESVAGASIQAIEEEKIVLLHEGQRKVLILKVVGGGVENGGTASVLQNSSAGQESDSAGGQKRPSASSPDVQTRLGYVETILRQATIEPEIVEGEVEGLRITGLADIPAARAVGLRDNDVIRQVNGHAVTSKQKAFQILMKARSQPRISIDLSRGHRTRRLSFDLQ